MLKKWTQAENGKLILENNDYKSNIWMYVLVFVLLFIPLLDLFDLFYLMPAVLMSENIRKARTRLYEQISDGQIKYLRLNGNLYNINDSTGECVEDNTLLLNSGCEFYKLILLNVLGLFIQLFVSNLIGLIIFGVVGYISNEFGRKQAENIVLKEIYNEKVKQVNFPNGEILNIKLNLEN